MNFPDQKNGVDEKKQAWDLQYLNLKNSWIKSLTSYIFFAFSLATPYIHPWK